MHHVKCADRDHFNYDYSYPVKMLCRLAHILLIKMYYIVNSILDSAESY